MKVSTICFWTIVFCTLLGFDGKSTASAERLLQIGLAGDDVYFVQTKLKEYGFYDGDLDKVFGIETKEAVCKFQVSSGLDADGIVGNSTLRALRQYKMINSSRGENSGRNGKGIASLAQTYYGIPYVWGGFSPKGFDCSGFVYYVYSQFSIDLPRTADKQFEVGMIVNPYDLQLGDLVFFTTYEPGPSHVGIYIGDGNFIHASSAAEQVTITSMLKPYYQSRFLGARRIFLNNISR